MSAHGTDHDLIVAIVDTGDTIITITSAFQISNSKLSKLVQSLQQLYPKTLKANSERQLPEPESDKRLEPRLQSRNGQDP